MRNEIDTTLCVARLIGAFITNVPSLIYVNVVLGKPISRRALLQKASVGCGSVNSSNGGERTTTVEFISA